PEVGEVEFIETVFLGVSYGTKESRRFVWVARVFVRGSCGVRPNRDPILLGCIHKRGIVSGLSNRPFMAGYAIGVLLLQCLPIHRISKQCTSRAVLRIGDGCSENQKKGGSADE